MLNYHLKKEIANDDDPAIMDLGSAPTLRKIVIDLCHKLYELTSKEVTYIEVGIYFGGTFKEVLMNCQDIKLKGIGIDFFEDFDMLNNGKLNTHECPVITMAIADKKYKELGLSNYVLLKGDSVEMLNSLEKMKNVVCFIDGNHTYEAVKEDFYATLEKMENGYIVLDDVYVDEENREGYGIYRFFQEIKDKFTIVFQDDRNVAFKIN